MYQLRNSSPSSTGPADAAVRRKVNLKAANGQYFVAEEGGGGVVNANRGSAGPWEGFTLIDLNGGTLISGDKVALQAVNGTYLVAVGGGGGALRRILSSGSL